MLQVFKNIGEIKKGIQALEDSQRSTKQQIDDIHACVGNLVTKDDCEGHRQALEESLEEPDGPEKLGLLERGAKHAKALTAILVLMGMLGGGLVWVSRVINRVETALTAEVRAQQQQTQAVTAEVRQQQVQTKQVLKEVRMVRSQQKAGAVRDEADRAANRERRRRRPRTPVRATDNAR